ncbi:MAG TPA: DNA gyrase inhibitor YacG [Methylomirabilota bacterium]|jgi:hypothetical protein|nr:DNA gyrase inhibitor YacG [Methylomirabilota bacterium]
MHASQPTSGGGAPRCPTCGAAVAWSGNPARPFCSLTCKLVDLGEWLDENYRMAGESFSEPAADDRPPREKPPNAE